MSNKPNVERARRRRDNVAPPPVRRALLVVVSAPSGGGKTTLCERLLKACPAMTYSVSCTTRPPRPGERNGRDYHFLAPEEFARRLRRGEFLEHAVVHGHHYGTLRAPVWRALRAGRDVLMDIDVQGAAQIRRAARHAPRNDLLRRGFVDIFVAPPSLRVLKSRLTARKADSPAVIARRLRNARRELRRWKEYSFLVINDRLETAFMQLKAIVEAAHCRVENQSVGKRGRP